jgi:hypothetical protein
MELRQNREQREGNQEAKKRRKKKGKRKRKLKIDVHKRVNKYTEVHNMITQSKEREK